MAIPWDKSEGKGQAAIESASNPGVKELRKALRQGGLFSGKFWIAESPKLLEEALRSGLAVPVVYVDVARQREFAFAFAGRFHGQWIALAGRALETLASVESSQGLLALVEKPTVEKPAVEESRFFSGQRLTVVLDRIQDPGNAGTILRAAEAFGATGIAFLAGSVSADTPKLLRASAGSRFRIPVLENLAPGQFLELANQQAITLYAAIPTAARTLPEVNWQFPAALIVGNEGAGVQAEIARNSLGFRIPTQGVESLNAGVSAAIALYAMASPKATGAASGAEGDWKK